MFPLSSPETPLTSKIFQSEALQSETRRAEVVRPEMTKPTALLAQVMGHTISKENLLELIQRYQLLPSLIKALIVDIAITPFTSTPEEESAYGEAFFTQRQLCSEEARQDWANKKGLTSTEISKLFARKIRIEKFKEEKFSHHISSYFLKRKSQLDYVVYSIIQHPDHSLIQELYFRLQEKEQSFAELAKKYSQGFEASTKGIKGPTPFSQIPQSLAELIRTSQPGEIRVGYLNDSHFLLRVEAFIPAVLDERMTQELLQELFDQWLEAEMSSINLYHARNSVAQIT